MSDKFDNQSEALSHPETFRLPEALNLETVGELVAFTGGGGKSSLMFALARTLPGRVIMTTTTRIFAAQMKLAPVVYSLSENVLKEAAGERAGEISRDSYGHEEFRDILARLNRYGSCLVVGEVVGDKALGLPPSYPGRMLKWPGVDHVLVEADGSRMRPCKAPADHEPVIPLAASTVVPVAGIDAVGGRLSEVAHRPERVALLTGLELDEAMTAEALATLITHDQGGLKGIPAAVKVIPFINKVETPGQLALARRVAFLALEQPRIRQVVIGAVRAARPVLEVHKRVTGVVLAAGESKRMGLTKQLLPWGESTVLGQTLKNLSQSSVHQLLVVSGHQAGAVEAIAAELGISTVHNVHYAKGEMLSSLQLAVGRLAENQAAVLVMLADQPMVRPETIDRLLAAYWAGLGDLIAPVFQGQRGNPVLIGRQFFPELMALPPGAAPRDLLRRHREQIYLVEVESASVLRDLDLPDEYERWRLAD